MLAQGNDGSPVEVSQAHARLQRRDLALSRLLQRHVDSDLVQVVWLHAKRVLHKEVNLFPLGRRHREGSYRLSTPTRIATA